MNVVKGFLYGMIVLALFSFLANRVQQRVLPGLPTFPDMDVLWSFCLTMFGIGLGTLLPVLAVKMWATIR